MLPINAASIGAYSATSSGTDRGSTSQQATASAAPPLIPNSPGSARVAKQPLHHAAGERQRGADQQRQQHSRQTNGQPDVSQDLIAGGQQAGQRQTHGAQGRGEQRQDNQQQRH
jgi:hypothetical protein